MIPTGIVVFITHILHYLIHILKNLILIYNVGSLNLESGWDYTSLPTELAVTSKFPPSSTSITNLGMQPSQVDYLPRPQGHS